MTAASQPAEPKRDRGFTRPPRDEGCDRVNCGPIFYRDGKPDCWCLKAGGPFRLAESRV